MPDLERSPNETCQPKKHWGPALSAPESFANNLPVFQGLPSFNRSLSGLQARCRSFVQAQRTSVLLPSTVVALNKFARVYDICPITIPPSCLASH